MLTMDDIFSQMFPFLTGISLDLGTVLMGILLLGFLLIGFDLVKLMLFGRYERRMLDKRSDFYLAEAEKYYKERNEWSDRESIEWQRNDFLFKENLRLSSQHKVKK